MCHGHFIVGHRISKLHVQVMKILKVVMTSKVSLTACEDGSNAEK